MQLTDGALAAAATGWTGMQSLSLEYTIVDMDGGPHLSSSSAATLAQLTCLTRLSLSGQYVAINDR